MKDVLKYGFTEMNQEELDMVQGGEGFEFGDWVMDYFDMVGDALHDAFGCYKCGFT